MSSAASSTFSAPRHAMSSSLTTPGPPTTPTSTDDLTARTPSAARRRRPLVRDAWYWENRKAPNRWYWGAVTVLCALASLSGYLQYRTYRDEFQALGATWDIIWPQSTLLLSMLILPLALSGFAAQIAAGEHQGRNWQRMSADHVESAIIAGKLLHGLQVAVTTTAILILTVALTGLVAGFHLPGLAAYLPRFGAVALGMWVILTFVTWLGTIMRSFASTMTTALLGAVAGTAMLLVAQPLSILNPMTALTRATASLNPEAMTSPSSAATDGLICLAWVAVLALVLLRTVRRW